MKQRILVLLLALLICLPVSGQQPASYESALSGSLQYLQRNVLLPRVASIGGDWTVFALARGGLASSEFSDYYESAVLKVLKERGSNQLHPFQSTDNARVTLALSALGKNPASVGNFDVTQPLKDISFVTEQGANGVSYAILALKACGSSVPDELKQWLLEHELEQGGWSIHGNTPEADVTAMVLQALSFDKEEEAISFAIERGLTALSTLQLEDGGFSNGGVANAESCAQVLCALSVLQLNPQEKLFKNGNSVVDALLSYYDETSQGFAHLPGGSSNVMATEQAVYALISYDRFIKGHPGIFDMSDTQKKAIQIRVEGKDACCYNGTVEFPPPMLVSELVKSLCLLDEQGSGVWHCRINERKVSLDQATVTGGERVEVWYSTEAPRIPKADLSKLNTDGSIVFSDDVGTIEGLKVLLGDQKAVTDSLGRAVFPELQAGEFLLQVSKNNAEGIPEILRLPPDTKITVSPAPTQPTSKPSSNIRVSFRLIGATQANGNIDLSNGDYKGSEYITWIPTITYSIKAGSSMGDLLDYALEKNRLSFRGLQENYISSVTAPKLCGGYSLKEFDHGAYSGWMFTRNGETASIGLNDILLQNGDQVIWHYVNDYRYELESGSGFYQPWLQVPDVAPKKADPQESNQKTPVPSKTPTPILTPTPSAQPPTQTNPVLVFSDVSPQDWYYDGVSFVVNQGWMKGISSLLFAPKEIMTRGMFLTVLYQLEGKTSSKTSHSFLDVSPGSWYENGILWGVEKGLVTGYGDGTFGPLDAITREQMAVLFYRYLGSPQSISQSLVGLSDQENVSDYARDAVSWAIEIGLMVGTGENKWSPQASATRGQMAVVLMRGESLFEK